MYICTSVGWKFDASDQTSLFRATMREVRGNTFVLCKGIFIHLKIADTQRTKQENIQLSFSAIQYINNGYGLFVILKHWLGDKKNEPHSNGCHLSSRCRAASSQEGTEPESPASKGGRKTA